METGFFKRKTFINFKCHDCRQRNRLKRVWWASLRSLDCYLTEPEPLPTHSYPCFMSPVHQGGEVLHPAISVGILEEHTSHILPTEVHLMRQLQHRLHSDVAASVTGKHDKTKIRLEPVLRGYFPLTAAVELCTWLWFAPRRWSVGDSVGRCRRFFSCSVWR